MPPKKPSTRTAGASRAKAAASKASATEAVPSEVAAKTPAASTAGAKRASTLDPTTASGPRPDSAKAIRRPKVEALVRRAKGSLAAAVMRRFVDVELLAQAAALALYAMLSLAPLLLILVWLTSSMLPGAQEALMQQIAMLLGSDAELVARTIVGNAGARPDTGSIAGWWSLALLAVGATAVFAQLQDVLNKIFRTDATRLPGIGAWLLKRVFSLGLVLTLGFLLLVSMTINTVLQLAFAQVEWMLPVMVTLATWLIYAAGFGLMYRYLPDREVDWGRALGGGAATALLFVLGRAAIAWYLERADPGSAYGSMGALMLALVWIYYAALVVFVGALFTAVVDERAHAARNGE